MEYKLLWFIVVTAAKMNFISLKIITEKPLEYECGITEYLPPLPLSTLLITYSMLLYSFCWRCVALVDQQGVLVSSFNSPFKVTLSFNKLVNIFRLPCKIYMFGLNSDLTVMSSVLYTKNTKNGQKLNSYDWKDRKKYNSPISLSRIL